MLYARENKETKEHVRVSGNKDTSAPVSEDMIETCLHASMPSQSTYTHHVILFDFEDAVIFHLCGGIKPATSGFGGRRRAIATNPSC